MNESLAAALASRYTIERELGAGGMATVYLAHHVKHRRQVALKVLRPELSAAMGHDRFLREITTTANLRHPNILPLFDSGEIEGHVFYVMPYIEGESLRERLARDGALPLEDAVRIADEVADALNYAHERGVIHRDIKPENIMLERDHAIVADFGIAHAASHAGDEKLTMVGMAVGTPHYMSPEQGSGETVDARSDLYALACVTYEMITGAPPFNAATAMAIIVQHVMQPVPSLQTSRPDVEAYLAIAVERALAKSPDERFATLREFREALKRTGETAAVSRIEQRVAVFHKAPPLPANTLLGREFALNAAMEKIQSGARVLTVTGYGGTGKTRFAIELFSRLEKDYPDGAGFISLASVTSASDVLTVIGATLDVAEAHGRSPLEALATTIGDRRVLLVLDNLEQVLGSAGDIASLVSRCKALQVVATSRAPLKVGAEVEFSLSPLDLPAPNTSMEKMRECASVALFVQRAEKVKPGFVLTDANASHVASICRQLDGLPLALELAAARVRILEPAALLKRLDQALDILSSGDRDLPARQRTLRATIQWSYSLLDPSEQQLLRRLSIFHEGWTFEQMERVCYSDDDQYKSLDELDSLVEKGLVRVVGTDGRYGLLETIRAFAREQLKAAGEVDAIRNAHTECFLEFAVKVDSDIRGEAQVDAMRRASRDNANVHVAMSVLSARAQAGDMQALEKALVFAGALNWYWHMAGQHLTANVILEPLLARSTDRPPSAGRAKARLALCMISSVTSEWDVAERSGAGGYDDAMIIGNDDIAAEAKMMLGYCMLSVGRMPEALEALDRSFALCKGEMNFMATLSQSMKGLLLFISGDGEAGTKLVEEAVRIQRERGDYEGGGMATSFLAQMTFAKGDLPRALQLYNETLDKFYAVGDKPEIARVHCEIGWVAIAAEKISIAQRAFQMAVRSYQEVGSARGTGLALMGLAAVEAAAGRTERAVIIAEAATSYSARTGAVIAHPMDPGAAARIAALKESIPQRQLESLLVGANSMSPAEVLAMVAESAQ